MKNLVLFFLLVNGPIFAQENVEIKIDGKDEVYTDLNLALSEFGEQDEGTIYLSPGILEVEEEILVEHKNNITIRTYENAIAPTTIINKSGGSAISIAGSYGISVYGIRLESALVEGKYENNAVSYVGRCTKISFIKCQFVGGDFGFSESGSEDVFVQGCKFINNNKGAARTWDDNDEPIVHRADFKLANNIIFIENEYNIDE